MVRHMTQPAVIDIGAAGLMLNDTSLGLKFGDVWFNAPPQPEARGVKEDRTLASILGGTHAKLPWSLAWCGKPAATTTDMPFMELPADSDMPKIALLSPNPQSLATLFKVWDAELKKLGKSETPPAEPPARRGGPLDLEALANKITATDRAPANGSSIAILLEQPRKQGERHFGFNAGGGGEALHRQHERRHFWTSQRPGHGAGDPLARQSTQDLVQPPHRAHGKVGRPQSSKEARLLRRAAGWRPDRGAHRADGKCNARNGMNIPSPYALKLENFCCMRTTNRGLAVARKLLSRRRCRSGAAHRACASCGARRDSRLPCSGCCQ